MPNAKYTVTNTEPWTYLDGLRNPVQGFRVTFTIYSSGDVHFVNVPALDKAVVQKAIEQVVAQVEAIRNL